MTKEFRNRYLGIETDPQEENRRFKIRFAICITFIGICTIIMLSRETRSMYKGKQTITIQQARKGVRKTQSLFDQ